MMEVLGVVLLLLGTGFVFVAGMGIIRLPDVLMRMHASTKAGTLGVALISLSAVCFYGTLSVAARVIALVFFMLLTAPVAAHMIGRASYQANVPLWEGTFIDEQREYNEGKRLAEQQAKPNPPVSEDQATK